MNIAKPKIILILLFFLAIAGSSFASVNNRYSVGLKYGLATLSGGLDTEFPFKKFSGLTFGYKLSPKWDFKFGYSGYSIKNDITLTGGFSFGGSDEDATTKWKAGRVGISFGKKLFSLSDNFGLDFRLGSGLMIWEYLDPESDTVFNVQGVVKQTVDYAATEIFINFSSGININLSRTLTFAIEGEALYLTGAGAEFDDAVSIIRDQWLFGISANFRFNFDIGSSEWISDENWTKRASDISLKRPNKDSDKDGVPDIIDKCPNTRVGLEVDRNGCARDSDGDGIKDGDDHCPHTHIRAIGMVDIFGCPVDSDFDGIADYLDNCPYNKIGAKVDENGCPIDSDLDGVPDGLDDCPFTLFGVDVDKNGCIDLSMLSKPLVLHIDYSSGSFEIDNANKEILTSLSRLLNFVKEIKMEINGYTDNIGTSLANKKLSQKRANRVKDYLVNLGISSDRVKAIGMGEKNFVASNKTAKGRNENRRVEIHFHR